MMHCAVFPMHTLENYKFVVVLSFMDGQCVLSRHRARTTWETQGGHIEPGETPLEAAKRELWEESGATAYSIEPLCDYRVTGDDGCANGVVFRAEITALGPLPESEMEAVRRFSTLPENLTYPEITPILFARALEQNK